MRLIATFALLLTAGCSTSGTRGQADTAAVYEAFLSDGRWSMDGPVLLQDVTVPVTSGFLDDEPGRPGSVRFSAEVRQAFHDLVKRSRATYPLPHSVHVALDQTRISADSVQAIFRTTRDRAARRLPDGASVVQLSHVGFDRGRTVAVVYGSVVCGYLCGGATLRVARKHPGGWIAAEDLVSVIY
jgi:hypothetical protein